MMQPSHQRHSSGYIMLDAFKYIMECYFYQDWQSEFSQEKEVLIFFAKKENLEIVNNVINDIKVVLENDLSGKIFQDNDFDFDPLLEGYNTEKEWFEYAYELLTDEISKRE